MFFNQNTRTVIFYLSLLITLILVIFFILYKRKSEIETVDFNKTVKTNSTQIKPIEMKPLRIAVAAMISPSTTYEYYSDLITAVAEKVGRKAEFIQKKTYAQVNDMLEKREIDLAFVCSGPYVDGREKFGLEILAEPVVHGKTVYYSYILAHKDSSYSSLADLKGKRFAFTDPDSNTGHIVPQYMLSLMNEIPENFFSEIIYTYSHDNSIKAVAQNICDGAAVDHLIWEFLNNTEPEYTSQTKIIQKSEPFGIPPIVVHPDMDKDLKIKLKNIFLTLHEDNEVKQILNRLQIERFEKGSDSNYNSIRQMKIWINKNIKGTE